MHCPFAFNCFFPLSRVTLSQGSDITATDWPTCAQRFDLHPPPNSLCYANQHYLFSTLYSVSYEWYTQTPLTSCVPTPTHTNAIQIAFVRSLTYTLQNLNNLRLHHRQLAAAAAAVPLFVCSQYLIGLISFWLFLLHMNFISPFLL